MTYVRTMEDNDQSKWYLDKEYIHKNQVHHYSLWPIPYNPLKPLLMGMILAKNP